MINNYQKPNPDDRSDNVEKLQDMVQRLNLSVLKALNTNSQISSAEECSSVSDLPAH